MYHFCISSSAAHPATRTQNALPARAAPAHRQAPGRAIGQAGAEEAVLDMVKSNGLNGKALRDKVKDTLAEYLYKQTKRRPMVIPVVLE